MNDQIISVFEKFCDGKSRQLRRPFVINGMLYATSGNLCVRTKFDGQIEDQPENHPNPESLYQIHLEFTTKPTTGVAIPEQIGEAFTESTCHLCDGKGLRRCDLGHDHECDECEGTGKIRREVFVKLADKVYCRASGLIFIRRSFTDVVLYPKHPVTPFIGKLQEHFIEGIIAARDRIEEEK